MRVGCTWCHLKAHEAAISLGGDTCWRQSLRLAQKERSSSKMTRNSEPGKRLRHLSETGMFSWVGDPVEVKNQLGQTLAINS